MSWWWRQISALLLHSFTVCQLSRSDSLCIMCACQTPSDLILNSSYMLLLSEPRIIIDHSHQIYVFHMQSGSVGLCGHSAATESWLCDSAVGLWVLGMWKRCRLDCVTELCSGRRSLMKGGKQTDWQRKNRVHGDMGTWWTTKSALLPIAPWASWEMCMWESWHVSVCEYSLMLFFPDRLRVLQTVQRLGECQKMALCQMFFFFLISFGAECLFNSLRSSFTLSFFLE